jgi:glycosyltransferase involved in cell wall biosynthesis
MRHVKTPHAKLVLVGEGPSLARYKKLAASYGLEEKIIFTGLQSAEAVAAMLKQSDIFCLASYRFDNQPMVILEAIASGLPVVYCDDNLQEGLTTKNSILTEGQDSESFARAFDELLGDQKRLKMMSDASLELAQKFDTIQLAKRLVKYYKGSIAAAKKAATSLQRS